MDSDSSNTNLMIITRRARLKRFFRLYWKNIVMLMTPLLLLPIYFAEKRKAYPSLYVFSVTMVYWITNVMHPGVTSMVPITFHSLIGSNMFINTLIPVGCELFDCLSIMIIIVAIENSNLHRRIAVKLLVTFGCSHYRLSFMLFCCTMFLSMWLTEIVACGLMMPLIKAILVELEKMGIFEMHHTIEKIKEHTSHYREIKNLKPSDITVFYFLGIAYSASTGSMATLLGSRTNQIFKVYSEKMFPLSPKIEFPHFILLNLPGVLLIEGLLYVWMNSYFLGMFRGHADMSLEIGLSEEEAIYIRTLLSAQYKQLGRITFHESVVAVILIITCILKTSFGYSYLKLNSHIQSHLTVASAPIMLSAILLFVLPVNLDFIKFFKRRGREPLPTAPSKACLNWKLVHENVHWSVLFVMVGSSSAFFSLFRSGVGQQAVGLVGRQWPAPARAFMAGVLGKLCGEAAGSATVAFSLLPSIGQLSVETSINPHYLMLAVAQACSLPYHMITGSPVNAMVAAYVRIPTWKMMAAGVGPSVIALVVIWFTVAVWSRVIWTDNYVLPLWAHDMRNISFLQ